MIGEGFHAGPARHHAERVALAACAEDPAGRHALRLARALRPPRPHAAVHRGDPRGRHRARGRGLRRPDAQGLGPRPRASCATRAWQVDLVDGAARGGGAAAQPALPQARAHRPPARGLQVGDDARRQGGHPHRRLPVDLGRGEPRPRAPLARRVRRRGGGDRHRARRRPAAHRPRSRAWRASRAAWCSTPRRACRCRSRLVRGVAEVPVTVVASRAASRTAVRGAPGAPAWT